MRRFDIPPAPVAGRHGDLIRLVDPRGLAVAWLDPQAGRCIGYAVRPEGATSGGWRELLGGADRNANSPPNGGMIAGGPPWRGETPLDPPARWQLVERDPTAATLACRCVSRHDPARIAALTLTVWLDEGLLWLRLVARAQVGDDLRPRIVVAIPDVAASGEYSLTGAASARALRPDGAGLCLTATAAPPWHASWSGGRDTPEPHTLAAVASPGPAATDVDRCQLTLTVGPRD